MSKSFEDRMREVAVEDEYQLPEYDANRFHVPFDSALQLAREADALKKPRCRWKPYPADGPMPGCYDTTCGQVHYLSEGNLADNHYKYCCYCGGEIEEEKA
jgi:hypothetical protein